MLPVPVHFPLRAGAQRWNDSSQHADGPLGVGVGGGGGGRSAVIQSVKTPFSPCLGTFSSIALTAGWPVAGEGPWSRSGSPFRDTEVWEIVTVPTGNI